MMEKILKGAAVAAICAVVVFGIVRGYETWKSTIGAEYDKAGAARIQGRWDADVILRDELKLKAVNAARAEEKAIAAAAAKGELNARKNAEQRAKVAEADAALSTTVLGGLRDQAVELDRIAGAIGVPDAATAAAEFVKQRADAVRARKLLTACGAEYQDMGRRTDESWNAISLKLDIALGYIDAVAPK